MRGMRRTAQHLLKAKVRQQQRLGRGYRPMPKELVEKILNRHGR